MTLTVAFDHGGRRDIVEAARSLVRDRVPAEEITEETFARHLPHPDTPEVDLVIRTSGEQRISNFMLWHVAYAEWVFPLVLWPDFRAGPIPGGGCATPSSAPSGWSTPTSGYGGGRRPGSTGCTPAWPAPTPRAARTRRSIPGARAWVVATLFESTVTMYRLGGRSLDGASLDRLYAEFRLFLAHMEGGEGELPPTLREFWRYYDLMVEERLENTEAAALILHRLFAEVPAPPVLRDRPAVWAAGRALAAPLAMAVTVGSLPAPLRERLGLAEIPGARWPGRSPPASTWTNAAKTACSPPSPTGGASSRPRSTPTTTGASAGTSTPRRPPP
jgi:Putative undecaprenyl diphosphate synthase/ER-bound oxygenase mpaB/B'/Rubber oxygenase, catalytic domain